MKEPENVDAERGSVLAPAPLLGDVALNSVILNRMVETISKPETNLTARLMGDAVVYPCPWQRLGKSLRALKSTRRKASASSAQGVSASQPGRLLKGLQSWLRKINAKREAVSAEGESVGADAVTHLPSALPSCGTLGQSCVQSPNERSSATRAETGGERKEKVEQP